MQEVAENALLDIFIGFEHANIGVRNASFYFIQSMLTEMTS